MNSSKRIFKNAIHFLKKINSPFVFSFLHTYQVHSPYKIHRGLDFSEKLIKKNYPKRFSMLRALGNSKNFLYKPLSKETKEKIIDFYDAEIEYFDQWFGYFITELKKLKIYNNSLIIVCSDHGEEFYSHKGWGHGHSLYNEAIRVPLIIKFPGQTYRGRGKKIDENVGLIDIFPTILDYYNIKFSKKIDGMSLLDCINGKTGNFVDRKIISVLKRNFQNKIISPVPEKISIVYKNFKLIYNYKYSKQTKAFFSQYPPPLFKEYEFYNLSTDFAEKNNLAYDAKFSKIIERLKTEIDKTKRKIEESINPLSIKHSKEDLEKIKGLGYL
jgi:arylsulfatase A-like enzyme